MWPWDHLAVGYLSYFLLTRVTPLERSTAATAVAGAVGTQFPDLVDKPLGWWLDVFPAGTGVAHSLLVAVPLCLVGLLVGWRLGRREVAAAFAVGYLSHLPGDVLYPVALGGERKMWILLWPLTSAPGPGTSRPLSHVLELVVDFLAFLATPRGLTYLALEVLLLGCAALAWYSDGCPGYGRPTGT